MEGKTIFFRGIHRLSRTGIVECLKIIDVGCNLQQFDGLTWQTLSPDPRFYDKSTPLTPSTASYCIAVGFDFSATSYVHHHHPPHHHRWFTRRLSVCLLPAVHSCRHMSTTCVADKIFGRWPVDQNTPSGGWGVLGQRHPSLFYRRHRIGRLSNILR